MKPGPVGQLAGPDAPDGPGGAALAPHIDISIFSRGLLDRLITRVYFDDEAGPNAADPVLQRVPEARRGTLIARSADDGYHFDIRLRGTGETVFFDL